jgi:hypothetical protein
MISFILKKWRIINEVMIPYELSLEQKEYSYDTVSEKLQKL